MKKRKLTVYFDYICPYCYRGLTDLMDLLPQFPDLSVEWIPCEAHPRPERMWIYSDIASQAMLYIQEYSGDLIQFHKKIFYAHFKDHKRIDDIKLLAKIGEDCGASYQEIENALNARVYAQRVEANNDLVWEQLKFAAVPCYELDGRMLRSIEDVIISKERLKKFLMADAK
ncbi:MAG: DsbA family protein [Lachnospiraceae bacterium]|nr:DsbA family protein [Lachnospiraceae bacterium]